MLRTQSTANTVVGYRICNKGLASSGGTAFIKVGPVFFPEVFDG